MKTFKNELKVFGKSKIVILTMIAFVLVTLYFIIKPYFQFYRHMEVSSILGPMQSVLKLSLYVFAVFLLLSFIFFAEPRRVNLYETLRTSRIGVIRINFAKLSIFVICGIILSVIYFVYVIVCFCNTPFIDISFAESIPYIKNVTACIVVYIFLVSVLGSVLGMTLAGLEKRLVGIAIGMLAIFLTSHYFESISYTIMETQAINIYPISNFFKIVPINLNFMPNYSTGFALLPYKVFIVLFWISALLFIYGLKNTQQKHRKLMAAVLAPLCLVFLICYLQPSSKVVMNFDPNGSAIHDELYYANTVLKEEAPDFRVTKYNLDIKVRNQLKIRAKLSVDNGQDTYNFTLYHGYKIKSICDQNGNALEYLQSEDYFTVTAGDSKITDIIITYTGSSHKFYSNSQGIYLPGGAAYYPRAGFIKLNSDYVDIMLQFPKEQTAFTVHVDYNKEVYSNLPSVGYNTFDGKVAGVTLYSGILKVKEKGSIRFIYPYLFDENREDIIDATLDSLINEGLSNDMTIFIIPNLNQRERFYIADDHVLSQYQFSSLAELRQEYEDGQKAIEEWKRQIAENQ